MKWRHNVCCGSIRSAVFLFFYEVRYSRYFLALQIIGMRKKWKGPEFTAFLIGGTVEKNWQNPLTDFYGTPWHSGHSIWSPTLHGPERQLCPILTDFYGTPRHSRHSIWSPTLHSPERQLCSILPFAFQPVVGQDLLNIEASRWHSGHITHGRIPLD